jgi:hypothetical protein
MDAITTPTRRLAGIQVPTTPIIERAIEYARGQYEPYLFNHVVRSWLFATRIAQHKEIDHDAEVLALGTLLHDVTLNKNFAGPRRFEVEGADRARDYVRKIGFDLHRAQLIWDSVALNSTPSIGLYKEAEVALCTAGICFDVIGLQYDLIPSDEREQIIAEFPRLRMKARMTRCFCQMVRSKPETTYDNFLRDFGERFVAGYTAPSVVDLLVDAPFPEQGFFCGSEASDA